MQKLVLMKKYKYKGLLFTMYRQQNSAKLSNIYLVFFKIHTEILYTPVSILMLKKHYIFLQLGKASQLATS